MDNWTFGITMTVVGTGATFIILGILVLLIGLLKKAFPVPGGPGQNGQVKGS